MASNRVESELATIRTALLKWLDITNAAMDAKINENDLFDYQQKVADEHINLTHALMSLADIEEDHDSRPTRQTPTLQIVAQ
tara:strand:+ start:7676 stop:7921 length:246 start_codon:yes stop_codon:yes gene_type:complete